MSATAPLSPGEMKDLCTALCQAVPGDFPARRAGDWLGRKGELGNLVRMVLQGCEIIPPAINWPLTYEKLGMATEYAEAAKKLVFPPENPGQWIVPMIPGVTPNRVVDAYRRLKVDVYTYRDDLDAVVTENDRDPNRDGAYLFGCWRTIEADGGNANRSAVQLAEVGHRGIVLCERLVLGFGYYVTIEQHLDVKNITLCAGSRDQGGNVPYVYFSPGSREVYVGWCSPDSSDDSIRSRSVQFPLPA